MCGEPVWTGRERCASCGVRFGLPFEWTGSAGLASVAPERDSRRGTDEDPDDTQVEAARVLTAPMSAMTG